MRLLPRTVRGTVLLAAAVWLAGAVPLWNLLPVRPRATWTLPTDAGLCQAVPGRDRLVIASSWSDAAGTVHHVGPLHMVRMLDGQVERTFLDGRDIISSFWVSS